MNRHFPKVYYLIFHPAPSAPLNPMITAVNKTTIDLQWTVPITTNGIIQKYRVIMLLYFSKAYK